VKEGAETTRSKVSIGGEGFLTGRLARLGGRRETDSTRKSGGRKLR